MSKSVTISTSAAEKILRQIAEIDGKLETVKGTASQRKAAARVAVLEDSDLAGVVDAVETKLAEAKMEAEEVAQRVEDAIVAYLKSSKDGTTAEVEALKTSRSELVTSASAMIALLQSLKVEGASALSVPKAPKGASRGSTGSTGAKASSGRHYFVSDEGRMSSYANSSLSGLAFYAFRVKGASPSVEDVKTALASQGVTDLTKSWQATVTLNGVTRTIGHEVTVTPAVEEAAE